MTDAEPQTVRLAEPGQDTLYDLLSEAGSGGMGTVYRARDRETGQLVAVKLLKKEGDSVRFALEISALARLRHPNIVRYLGHGVTAEGAQFLAMEWLEGRSLEEEARSGAIPLRRVLEIGRDVASALAYAHAAGVVHRDLKPTNVFLSKTATSEAVKILDFGIARLVEEPGFTRTGQVIGTPSYMAPEQARGERVSDPRADLFSLGCVLHRCIAGSSPFAAPDVLAILTKLATHTPPRLKDVPRGVADLVEELLAKDPTARPRSATDVKKTIDALLATRLELEREPTETPKVADDQTLASAATEPRAPRRRPRWPLVAGSALAIALAVGGAALWKARTARRASDASRAPAGRACRTWATELARRQHADGSFTGEPHREPTGWDTGQELTALERASSCATIAPVAFTSATKVLVAMRQSDGWHGPDKFGRPASVAADGWATIALAGEVQRDPSAREAALSARTLLLSRQRADGGFAMSVEGDVSHAYATMLAVWALVGAEPLDGAEAARAARARATARLREMFRGPAVYVRDVAGFEEQVVWVLLQARASGDRADSDLLVSAAKDLIARCALDRATGACGKPVYEDGSLPLGPEQPKDGALVILWHPWVALAAEALARSDVELGAEIRADLEAIVTWSIAMIQPSIDALAEQPEYRLAEYLMAASALASPR